MPVIAIGAAIAGGIGAAAATIGGVLLAGASAVGGFLMSSAGSMVASFGLNALSAKLGKQKQGQAAASFDSGIQVNKIDPAAPIPVVYGRRTVGGCIAFRDTGGKNNKYLYQAMILSEGVCESVEQVFINSIPLIQSQRVYSDLEPRSGSTNFEYRAGSDFKIPIGDLKERSDAIQSLIDTDFVSGEDGQTASNKLNGSDKWSTQHRGSGLALLTTRFEFNRDEFPGGIPKITVDLKGIKITDPRNPGAAKAWSDNPALCIRDYMINTRYGCGVNEDFIDEDSFIIAANYCDGLIDNYKDTNGNAILSQKRYTLNGVINTDEKCLDNLNSMLTSCRGMIIFSGGKYKIILDKPETARAYHFSDSDIFESFDISGGSKRSVMNRIISRYFSAHNKFNETFSVIDFPDARVTDNGTLHKQEFRYAFTTEPQRCAFLSTQAIKQSRQQWTVKFTTSLKAIDVEVGDVVNVTHFSAGYTAKPFRVTLMKITEDDMIEIQAMEYDDSVYSFELDAPPLEPDTDNPTTFSGVPPVNFKVESGTEHLQRLPDGTINTRAFLTWQASDKGYSSEFEIAFKLSRDPDTKWTEATTGAFSHYFGPLRSSRADSEETFPYDFRIRSINPMGVRSAYIYLNEVFILGKLEKPNPPSDFKFEQGQDFGRRFVFIPPSDIDLVGQIIRFSKTETTWDNMDPLHTGVITVSPYETSQILAGTYNFAIRSIDTSGILSDTVLITGIEVKNKLKISILDAYYPHLEKFANGERFTSLINPAQTKLIGTDREDWESFNDKKETINSTMPYYDGASLMIPLTAGEYVVAQKPGAIEYRIYEVTSSSATTGGTLVETINGDLLETAFNNTSTDGRKYFFAESSAGGSHPRLDPNPAAETSGAKHFRIEIDVFTTWSDWTSWIRNGNNIQYLQQADLLGDVDFVPFQNIQGDGTTEVFYNVGLNNRSAQVMTVSGTSITSADANNDKPGFITVSGSTSNQLDGTYVLKGSTHSGGSIGSLFDQMITLAGNQTPDRFYGVNILDQHLSSSPVYCFYDGAEKRKFIAYIYNNRREHGAGAINNEAVFQLGLFGTIDNSGSIPEIKTDDFQTISGRFGRDDNGETGAWCIMEFDDTPNNAVELKSIAAFHTGYTKSIPPFAVDAANEFTKIALTQSGQTGSFATTNQANFAAVSNGTLTLNPASTTFSPTLSVGAMRGRYFSYLINQIPGTFINDYKRATIDASTILLDGELFEENLLIDSTGSSQPGVFTKTGNGIGFITTTRAFVNITSIICQTINNVNGQVDVISDNPGNSTSDEASGIKIRTYVPTQTSATVGTAMKVAIQIKGF